MPRGVYKRTKEHNKNTSLATKKYWTEEKREAQRQRMMGNKPSLETREKHRLNNLGEKNPMFGKKMSEEDKQIRREKMSGENNPNYGIKRSPESKEKQRQRMLGENNPMFGRTHTLETRILMGEKNSGKNNGMYGRTGENSPSWNTDREEVARNAAAYSHILYSLNLPFGGKVSKAKMLVYLGYTEKLYVGDMESKFYNGMTWQSYGKNQGHWQRHHKIQVTWFYEFGIYNVKIINALPNLLPLWHEDHREAQRILNTFTEEQRKFWVELWALKCYEGVDFGVRWPLDLGKV